MRHCYFQGQGNHPYWYRFVLTADIGYKARGNVSKSLAYNVLLNVHVMRLIMYLYDNANIVKQESVNVIECFRNQIQYMYIELLY